MSEAAGAARVFSSDLQICNSHSRVEAVHDMTEYVSQGDGFLMDDNDPSRPMVMYYHNLIMQYAEQGDVQSVRHNLRLVKDSPGALGRALHRAALGDGSVLKVLLRVKIKHRAACTHRNIIN